MSNEYIPLRPSFFQQMNAFDDYFTARSIVNVLIGIRLKVASKRHTAHFFRNLSADADDPARISSTVDALLPPRRQWFRPGRNVRPHLSAANVKRRGLFNAVMHGLENRTNTEAWLLRLRKFILQVQNRAKDPSTSPLQAPSIRPIVKEKGRKSSETTYRVLAVFEDLSDRVLLGLTARYLGHAMDNLFMDCSHAFRVNRKCSRDVAVRKILEYVATRQGQKIYSAECDIQKFFDSIDHDVARRAFTSAIEKIQQNEGNIDARAIKIFGMYLNAYDFFGVGEPAAKRKLAADKMVGTVDGPDAAALKLLRRNDNLGGIGIPQGGALSPFIANLVLDAADQSVLGDGFDKDLLYLRYCDDMLILHTRKSACSVALRRYTDALSLLCLPVHTAEKSIRYGREFYGSKSKRPYRLEESSTSKSASPWVTFLGYQIRCDGSIRVRKESLDKHKQKQRALAGVVLRLIARPRAKLLSTNTGITMSVALRLVAASVGKARLCASFRVSAQPCWTDAFRLLTRNEHSERQMRDLDRYRDRLIRKIRRSLVRHRPQREAHVVLRRPFIGRPLSYCGRLLGTRVFSLMSKPDAGGGYGRIF